MDKIQKLGVKCERPSDIKPFDLTPLLEMKNTTQSNFNSINLTNLSKTQNSTISKINKDESLHKDLTKKLNDILIEAPEEQEVSPHSHSLSKAKKSRSFCETRNKSTKVESPFKHTT